MCMYVHVCMCVSVCVCIQISLCIFAWLSFCSQFNWFMQNTLGYNGIKFRLNIILFTILNSIIIQPFIQISSIFLSFGIKCLFLLLCSNLFTIFLIFCFVFYINRIPLLQIAVDLLICYCNYKFVEICSTNTPQP